MKNSKIQNGRHFWRDKIFLKIGMATLQIYPVGQKFRRNRSILQGFRDISIFMFCNFCEKFKNSKWPPFLARQKFFQNWDNYSADSPRLLPKPAKFEKNLPNGYRVIRKTKCGAGGAAGA